MTEETDGAQTVAEGGAAEGKHQPRGLSSALSPIRCPLCAWEMCLCCAMGWPGVCSPAQPWPADPGGLTKNWRQERPKGRVTHPAVMLHCVMTHKSCQRRLDMGGCTCCTQHCPALHGARWRQVLEPSFGPWGDGLRPGTEVPSWESSSSCGGCRRGPGFTLALRGSGLQQGSGNEGIGQ